MLAVAALEIVASNLFGPVLAEAFGSNTATEKVKGYIKIPPPPARSLPLTKLATPRLTDVVPGVSKVMNLAFL